MTGSFRKSMFPDIPGPYEHISEIMVMSIPKPDVPEFLKKLGISIGSARRHRHSEVLHIYRDGEYSGTITHSLVKGYDERWSIWREGTASSESKSLDEALSAFLDDPAPAP